jgi:hypothetical protein
MWGSVPTLPRTGRWWPVAGIAVHRTGSDSHSQPVPTGDHLLPAAPERRGQVTQDRPDLRRGRSVVHSCPPVRRDRAHGLAGRPGGRREVVDGIPPRTLLGQLRKQPSTGHCRTNRRAPTRIVRRRHEQRVPAPPTPPTTTPGRQLTPACSRNATCDRGRCKILLRHFKGCCVGSYCLVQK